jgi:hypothetical protein
MMAKSPSHLFGQIIGNVLEDAVQPILRQIAVKHGLFLDVKGKRSLRKKKKKITWLDIYETAHDLDFVLERGGTDKVQGSPVAFVETAWRRYTKHSRNKAQEIQGAILPLRAANWQHCPFMGVILAGEYTEGALEQLRRLNFRILHFSYETVVKVFAKYGIDASSDEDTPDSEFLKKRDNWKKLTVDRQEQLARDLAAADKQELEAFSQSLEDSITREIIRVRVLPLHGVMVELDTVNKALGFITNYNEAAAAFDFKKYEIEILYSNQDRVSADFGVKARAMDFLRAYLSPLRPASD